MSHSKLLKKPPDLTYKQLDFVLFYCEEDKEIAQKYVDKWTEWGHDGCVYDDKFFLDWRFNQEFDLTADLCYRTSFQIILVTKHMVNNPTIQFLKNEILSTSIRKQSNSVLPILYNLERKDIPEEKEFFGLTSLSPLYVHDIENERKFGKLFKFPDVIEGKRKRVQNQNIKSKQWDENETKRLENERILERERNDEREKQQHNEFIRRQQAIPDQVNAELNRNQNAESETRASEKKKGTEVHHGDVYNVHIHQHGNPNNIQIGALNKTGKNTTPGHSRYDRDVSVDASGGFEDEEKVEIERKEGVARPPQENKEFDFKQFVNEEEDDGGKTKENVPNVTQKDVRPKEKRVDVRPKVTNMESSFEVTNSGIVDSPPVERNFPTDEKYNSFARDSFQEISIQDPKIVSSGESIPVHPPWALEKELSCRDHGNFTIKDKEKSDHLQFQSLSMASLKSVDVRISDENKTPMEYNTDNDFKINLTEDENKMALETEMEISTKSVNVHPIQESLPVYQGRVIENNLQSDEKMEEDSAEFVIKHQESIKTMVEPPTQPASTPLEDSGIGSGNNNTVNVVIESEDSLQQGLGGNNNTPGLVPLHMPQQERGELDAHSGMQTDISVSSVYKVGSGVGDGTLADSIDNQERQGDSLPEGELSSIESQLQSGPSKEGTWV